MLNWEAVGAVGEIVGALAVVLSLVYLAVQVRQNNGMLRRAASRDAVASVRAVNQTLIRDPGMTQIVRQGLKYPEQMDDTDRARFHVFLFNFLKVYEDLHFHYKAGALEPAIWEGWVHNASAFLTTPGARSYWKERRPAFSAPFQAWVDSLRSDTQPFGDVGLSLESRASAGEGEV